MSRVCARCGKGSQRGHRVSHSGIRTKHVFKPNLHNFMGKRYCTKCLRRVKKEVSKEGKVSKVSKATQSEIVGSPV